MSVEKSKPFSWPPCRVGVIGAGKSGAAAALFLARAGARVLLSDRSPIAGTFPAQVELEAGGHSDRLLSQDLLIRSPGVPSHLAILKKAGRLGIPIWSELELASRFIKPKRLIAITGTNGKTTTTTLVGDFFKAWKRTVLVAGNIGTPLSAAVRRVSAQTTVVLEVSSYQLENIETFHPQIASILNLTPDHLDHHGSFKAYAQAKARIFENQTSRDVCVLNADDPECVKFARECRARVVFFSRRRPLKRGVYWDAGAVVLRGMTPSTRFELHWRLPGLHNIENALAAIAIAVAGGVPVPVIRKVLSRFKGVEHRLEFVREWGGVRYINDSKATNVDSTRVALESFDAPLWVIMGGRSKGTPYTSLRSLIQKHAHRILLIGEDSVRIEKDLQGTVGLERMGTLPRAVARARSKARRGDVVLLSPACASFDQYSNYEERGWHFKRLVKNLQ